MAEVGLEGKQFEEAAIPTGGEHPPGAREGSALWASVTMDETLNVAGTARSGLRSLGEECLKSLRSFEGILRYFVLLEMRSLFGFCTLVGERMRSCLDLDGTSVRSLHPLTDGFRKCA